MPPGNRRRKKSLRASLQFPNGSGALVANVPQINLVLITMFWFVLATPDGTPTPILELLEKHAREIAYSPAMKARLEELGMDAVGGSAADFRQSFDATGLLIEKLVKIAGARNE